MLRVGQKVICIDGSAVSSDCQVGMPQRPVEGIIYTVRSIQVELHIDGYGIRLEEIWNPSMIWSDGDEQEWSYDPRRFRPLDQAEQKDKGCGSRILGQLCLTAHNATVEDIRGWHLTVSTRSMSDCLTLRAWLRSVVVTHVEVLVTVL